MLPLAVRGLRACPFQAFRAGSRNPCLHTPLIYSLRFPPPRLAVSNIKPRFFGHLAGNNPNKASPQKQAQQIPKPVPEQQPKEDIHPTRAEQRRSDWAIIKQLFANVWPKDDWRTRGTVVLGFVLLFSAKVCLPPSPPRTPNSCYHSFSTSKYHPSSRMLSTLSMSTSPLVQLHGS